MEVQKKRERAQFDGRAQARMAELLQLGANDNEARAASNLKAEAAQVPMGALYGM